jgi:hypothetical protein
MYARTRLRQRETYMINSCCSQHKLHMRLFCGLHCYHLCIEHITSMASSSAPTSLPSPELIAYPNAGNFVAQAATLCAVALIPVLLRCYARVAVIKSFGYDNWAMLLAMVTILRKLVSIAITNSLLQFMAIATLVCIVLEVPYGLGKYLSVIQMDPARYQQLLKVRYVHQIICNAAATVVKISVSLFLLRFATTKAYRWSLHGLNVFLMAFMLTCTGTLGKPVMNGLAYFTNILSVRHYRIDVSLVLLY